jgi:hypothetical protein
MLGRAKAAGRVSDVDLGELIRTYELMAKTGGAVFADEVLLALQELGNRRAADDIRLGLKKPA